MAIFKCKMCGGDLNIAGDEKVVECDYCGSKQTVPDANDEKRVNLYNRANRLRMSCEFDKAEAIYEQIIAEFPEESEAYWGLCLCNYGIEYVDDPATAKKIPTCHRASFDKMRKDENYELALENADMSARIVYEEQAKEIDRIMGDILSVSRNEQPYDIFICYKESDNSRNRTPDSVLAQDIYDALTQKGYRVFFSRITLEDKLGSQYEPYIFSALNSAKMMLVVGTDYEYMNAVWVKNEWSRYLKLMAKDKSKILIPCYKDMDPYDMPDEFKSLQSQDCSKLGFMQDLLRGIDKLFGKGTEAKTVEKAAGNSATVDSLLKRAFMFLEDGAWSEADGYCEKVLDIEPENAEAYLGKLMAELEVRNLNNLCDCPKPFDNSNNYQKALRFGDDGLVGSLKGCIDHINNRNENARLMGIYDSARTAMNAANTEEAYKAAAQSFKCIQGYKDSDALIEQCLGLAEECRKKEEWLFSAIAEALTKRLHEEKAVSEEEKLAAAKKNAEAVAAVISIFDVTQSNIETATRQKAALQAKIESLKAKQSSLGIFDGKQKKQIESEIAEAKQSIRECDKKVFELQEKLEGYTSKNQAEDKLSELQKNIQNAEETIMKAQETGYASLTYEEAVKSLKDIKTKSGFITRYPEFSDHILFTRENRIRFGNYFSQNNNDKEPIEWRVLAKKENKILVISEYAIDCQKYNESREPVTWENCSLRKWMNGTFLNNAFSAYEQAQIQNTTVSADEYSYNFTYYGNATTDKVFLLSVAEVENYFTSDEDRKCVPTAYVNAQNPEMSDYDGTCWWWLRSPGDTQNFAALVTSDGIVFEPGLGVDDDNVCVRPALWINLDS